MGIIKKFDKFNEETKYEIGDKWSKDFDYDGMLNAVLDITEDTSGEIIEKIYKSLVDVNYHKEARKLDKYLTSVKNDNPDEDLLEELKNEIREEYFEVLESNETEELEALPVYVYRSEGPDTSARGISSREDILKLVFDGVSSPFKTKKGENYLVLKEKKHGMANTEETYKYVVPISIIEKGSHSMFGGNFVYSSDSRFPNKYPLPIHDRVER